MMGWFVVFLVLTFVISAVIIIVVALKRPVYHEKVSDLKGFEVLDCSFQPFSDAPTFRNHFTRSNSLVSIKKTLHGQVERIDSENWCGYVVSDDLTQPSKNSVTTVAASWTIPRLILQEPLDTSQYCSIWVGLDGYEGDAGITKSMALRPVQQIGTHSDWDASTQQIVHYAWFQVQGQPPKIIVGFPLQSGDSVSAEVVAKPNKKNVLVPLKASNVLQFQMTIRNNTSGVAALVPLSMSLSPHAGCLSAQFIIEAPSETSSVKQKVLPLADFGSVTFHDCVCTINGTLGPIQAKDRKHAPIFLIKNNNFQQYNLVSPSPLTPNKKSFTIHTHS
jgi:hypothetical protein